MPTITRQAFPSTASTDDVLLSPHYVGSIHVYGSILKFRKIIMKR